MVLDQIWVGPNMGPTKYAGPNLVQPKMANQKCLDQNWLDTQKYKRFTGLLEKKIIWLYGLKYSF